MAQKQAYEGKPMAVFRYNEPDLATPTDDNSRAGFPPNKSSRQETLPLHDMRTDPSITHGREALDTHGFTYITRKSILLPEDQTSEAALRDRYVPEVEELMREVTGAKKAIVVNVTFRNRKPAHSDDNEQASNREDEAFKNLLPFSGPIVSGTPSSMEPAQYLHCDYTLHGMMQLIAHGEQAFAEAGAEALRAYSERDADDTVAIVPRVAAYSVWRPLKTVKRDPLVVAAWKSIPQNDMVKTTYRAQGRDGEYTMEAWTLRPSDHASQHRWYWLPEQTPEEALIFKFSDTASVGSPDVAAWTAHGSPHVLGTEREEARESVEARVLVFW